MIHPNLLYLKKKLKDIIFASSGDYQTYIVSHANSFVKENFYLLYIGNKIHPLNAFGQKMDTSFIKTTHI